MAVPQRQNVFSIDAYHQKIRSQKPAYTERLLTIDEVAEKLNVSRSTAYRTVRDADFPERKRLSASTVRWLESEIDAWLHSK